MVVPNQSLHFIHLIAPHQKLESRSLELLVKAKPRLVGHAKQFFCPISAVKRMLAASGFLLAVSTRKAIDEALCPKIWRVRFQESRATFYSDVRNRSVICFGCQMLQVLVLMQRMSMILKLF